MVSRTPTSALEIVRLGIVYGLAGALVNIFLRYNVYGNMSFHFGEVLVILALVNCGLRVGLIASVITSFSLYLYLDNPFFFLSLGLETLLLGVFLRRGIQILIGDVIYWLIVGIPMTYLYLGIASADFDYDSVLIVLKQMVNGLLYVSIAQIIRPLVPDFLKSNRPDKNLPRLRHKIFEYQTAIATVASLVMGLAMVSYSVEETEGILNKSLQIRANQTKAFVANYITSHRNVVEHFSDVINHDYAVIDNPFVELERIQTRYPGFITMLLTDDAGNIIGGAPASFYAILKSKPAEQKNVKDREYFNQPKNDSQPYLSQAFQGRGFGDDIIVAVSSPFFKDGEFKGVVEGSLNLPDFSSIENDIELDNSQALILSDQDNRILYASDSLKLKVFDTLDFVDKKNDYSSNSQVIQFNQEQVISDYFYKTTTTNNHWKITVLNRTETINLVLEKYYLSLIVIFFFLMFLSILFSRYLSRELSQPLDIIVDSMTNDETDSFQFSSRVSFTHETYKVMQRLEKAKKVFLNFQNQLKREVEARTHELSEANSRLKKLAREDGLTGILNRREFDFQFNRELKRASRYNQKIYFAIMDIDHFKNINDTYGHPVGDQFIKLVADLTKVRLQRDTDLVARVGGEEFAVFFYNDDGSHGEQLLEEIRMNVEEKLLMIEDKPVGVTISIGAVSLVPEKNLQIATLYELADKRLYQSKKQGRNLITYTDLNI